jgi:hypothetical protein
VETYILGNSPSLQKQEIRKVIDFYSDFHYKDNSIDIIEGVWYACINRGFDIQQ